MDSSSLSELSQTDEEYTQASTTGSKKRKKAGRGASAAVTSRSRKRRIVDQTLPSETQSSVSVAGTSSLISGLSTSDTQVTTEELPLHPAEPTKEAKPRTRTRKPKEPPPEPTLADFTPRVNNEWKIGAHVSGAGGLENAVSNAATIGANAFALFLKSNRKWESPPLTEDTISKFRSRMKELNYDPSLVLPHSTYLINMAHSDDEKREKAYQCFADDLRRCEQLGLTLCNFHPGFVSAGGTKEAAITNIAACLNRAHGEFPSVVTVVECMAGTKNVVGAAFQDLADIIKLVEDKTKIGVCLDTCHMFAAGYDLRTKESYKLTMQDFDSAVGLRYLKGMHLNDSKTPFQSNKDRHENLGLGTLGIQSFRNVVNDPRTKGIPLVLETPGFDCETVWRKEVDVLNRISARPADTSAEESQDDVIVEEIREAIRAAEEAGYGAKGKVPKGRSSQGKTTKGKKRKKSGRDEDDENDEDDEMTEDG
ncbi:hypothetical protein FRC04_012102 [Tulasnella sp. 424]|nr:hypothetical protein FRC04_012102 [Tulasnella sp. 424]KAG8971086.1 hypothetical protein FRC05_011553 [Tulasnella sp. 425]